MELGVVNNKMGQSEGLPLPADSELQLALSASGLAEYLVAAIACDCALGVREDDLDIHALRAFDVHEVGVRALDEALELVNAFFGSGVWVQEIDFHFASGFFFFLK